MKIKIPKLRLRRRKKLRASAVRRSAVTARAMDYEEMSEPNMKLSRALLIVLVLHVVAVAGIIAFNSIKTHQSTSIAAPAVSRPAPKAEATPRATPVATIAARREAPKTSHSPARVVAKEQAAAVPVKSAEPADPGKIYTVVKGDNPVTIAKRLNVSYDELLALNHIEDPHKLQIGQKLRIPEKALKKQSEE